MVSFVLSVLCTKALGAQISSRGAADEIHASGSSGSSQCQMPMLYALAWKNADISL